MIYLILGTVFFVVIAVILTIAAYNDGDNMAILLGSIGSGCVAAILVITCICFGYGYHGASYKAKIINREYSTEYTQEEVFYAESVIDTIRELDRKRVEVNGDIMRDKPDNK